MSASGERCRHGITFGTRDAGLVGGTERVLQGNRGESSADDEDLQLARLMSYLRHREGSGDETSLN